MANQDQAVRHENVELFARAQAGDEPARRALILNHDSLIRNTVKRVVQDSNAKAQNPATVNAIARDASLIARREFEMFSGSYPQFRHWISVISRDHASEAVQQPEDTANDVDEFGYRSINAAGATTTSAEEPERGVDSNARASALLVLEQSLDRLGQADASVYELIWLKYKKGLSDQQIQTFIADKGEFISIREVRSRIKKGRALLGTYIRERGRDG